MHSQKNIKLCSDIVHTVDQGGQGPSRTVELMMMMMMTMMTHCASCFTPLFIYQQLVHNKK